MVSCNICSYLFRWLVIFLTQPEIPSNSFFFNRGWQWFLHSTVDDSKPKFFSMFWWFKPQVVAISPHLASSLKFSTWKPGRKWVCLVGPSCLADSYRWGKWSWTSRPWNRISMIFERKPKTILRLDNFETTMSSLLSKGDTLSCEDVIHILAHI